MGSSFPFQMLLPSRFSNFFLRTGPDSSFGTALDNQEVLEFVSQSPAAPIFSPPLGMTMPTALQYPLSVASSHPNASIRFSEKILKVVHRRSPRTLLTEGNTRFHSFKKNPFTALFERPFHDSPWVPIVKISFVVS